MSQIKLIVGLCNPGVKYQGTRHNAGEWLVNQLALDAKVNLTPSAKFFGNTAEIKIAGQNVKLLIPATFMNLSGKAVVTMANFYKILPNEILVVHDELDLPPGVARLKQGGGNGGHNGLKSIISSLANHNDFYRLRIGIGHPGNKNEVINYVLNKPTSDEMDLIVSSINVAVKSIDVLCKDGLEKAMNQLHANDFSKVAIKK